MCWTPACLIKSSPAHRSMPWCIYAPIHWWANPFPTLTATTKPTSPARSACSRPRTVQGFDAYFFIERSRLRRSHPCRRPGLSTFAGDPLHGFTRWRARLQLGQRPGLQRIGDHQGSRNSHEPHHQLSCMSATVRRPGSARCIKHTSTGRPGVDAATAQHHQHDCVSMAMASAGTLLAGTTACRQPAGKHGRR